MYNKETRTLSGKKIVQNPPYNRAGCIVEPYNASRQPKFQFCQKLVKVVTFMCARDPAPHVARGRKHCKHMASLYKHNMGKLQRAVTLIVRCESKICPVKSLVLTHSACPYKNYLPKYSQTPHELDYLII